MHAMQTTKQALMRWIGQNIPVQYAEKVVACSSLWKQFPSATTCRSLPTREAVWQSVVDIIGRGAPVLYLEFGVWQGESIRQFSQYFANSDSRFFGFDSFLGLPERWGLVNESKGWFSLGGSVPEIDDGRVQFVKGWFQNTFSQAIYAIEKYPSRTRLIHFDADLYSSTLFLLASLHSHLDEYFCIFDEFYNHESRALTDYVHAFGAKAEFLSARFEEGQIPGQILVRIQTNRGRYVVEQ